MSSSKSYSLRKRSQISYKEIESPKKRKYGTNENETSESSSDEDNCENVSPDVKTSSVSEYEMLRQKNIAEKMAMLEALNVLEAKENLKKFRYHLMPKPRPKKEPTVTVSCRRSLRLQNVAPSFEVRNETVEEEPLKYPPTPLQFQDVSIDCDEPVLEAFSDRLRKLYVKKNKLNAFPKYETCFSSMSTAPHLIAKIVPSIMVEVIIHPSPSSLLVCAGNRTGVIGMWSADANGHNSSTCAFRPHLAMVKTLRFHNSNQQKLFSCSYDGTVRCADLNRLVFSEVYSVPDDEDIGCTHMDFLDEHTLIIGHTDGTLGIRDIRSNTGSNCIHGPDQVHAICTRKLKTVMVHPVQNNYILTACVNGESSLYDLKMMRKKPEPLTTFKHQRSCSSAFFSPVTGHSVLTTSLDDTLRVYDTMKLDGSANLKTEIRHDNFTGRWVSEFRATWLPGNEECFVVGSNKTPRIIEVYNANSGELVHEFCSEHLSLMCSRNAFHPSRPILVGGSSGGKIFIFCSESE